MIQLKTMVLSISLKLLNKVQCDNDLKDEDGLALLQW